MFIKSNFIPIEHYDKHVLSKFKDKSISIFNDYIPTIEELNINLINILVIQEPNQLFGLHNWAIRNHQHFSCILTWGQDILDKCENALLLPFGTSFLDYEDKHKSLAFNKKHLEISFLCGPKNMIEGHYLRHKIWNKQNKINIPIKFIYEGIKIPCFEHSMFHIAVENSQNKNYFTEKIIDAFLTKTIPVYCGCPNIGDFFDENGIIKFNNEEELINIVNVLTEKDYWDRKDAIEYNYNVALYWSKYFERLMQILEEIIKLNNI
jgi:hypothetical protein